MADGMARRLSLVLMLSVSHAWAGELAGVTMADSIQVDDKTLTLNGMGLRTKFVFQVYVAGLYLEHPSKDAQAILRADAIRRVDLVMKRDLDRRRIIEGLVSGIEANTADQGKGVKERLAKFTAAIVDLKERQTLSIVYVPGQGTRIEGLPGAFVAEGKDFADAVFGSWLGSRPVDEAVKKGMLGH
jgi:hypothetical protein